jgi:type II restriction enzyme
MPVNLDKPQQWKADIIQSVDMYNDWFMKFAPQAFRSTRVQTTRDVEAALNATDNITNIQPALMREHPEILPTLRMSTCPPLAVDRLIGLAGVSTNVVKTMELDKRLPVRMKAAELDLQLAKIAAIIEKMADPDIFVWLGRKEPPTKTEIHRAATIVADRLCGAVANPIIRNAQEKRQLAAVKAWLEARKYKQLPGGDGTRFDAMPPGTFSFRTNVPVKLEGGVQSVNIPIDAIIMPKNAKAKDLPIFFEAKSAGDFTNTNKRRKEEAMKMAQLRSTYGKKIKFNLFLCGYFDSGYLGYEAAEGIDWVWEHRIDDLALFGIENTS